MTQAKRIYLLTSLSAHLFLFSAMGSEITVETATYKRIDDLEIKADVHRPNDESLCPVLVWIHGGALINGGRQGINHLLRDLFLEGGYALVSIDYRLAPESKLPEIIEDLEDAFKWLRQNGRHLFNLDTSKIAVAGGSAGGCLTLTSGFRVTPPPTVLVSLWGYGDLIGDWYSTPSPHPRHNRQPIAWEEVAAIPDGPVIANANDRTANGGLFYNYCRQQGLWPELVSGFDLSSEQEKFFPFMAVKNVTPNYPPTLLIHGTHDTDVPYEQSVLMVEQFKRHNVPHKLISIQGAEHGLRDGDPNDISQAYSAVLPFVNQYMR